MQSKVTAEMPKKKMIENCIFIWDKNRNWICGLYRLNPACSSFSLNSVNHERIPHEFARWTLFGSPALLFFKVYRKFHFQLIFSKGSFEREIKMPEQNEKDLVQFLLQISIDIKHHLKYRSLQERVELPHGYIGSKYKFHNLITING